MKKTIIVSILTILISWSTTGQEQAATEIKYTADLLITGKWYLEYTIVEEQKLEFAPEVQKRNWMLFHIGGKAEYMLENKQGSGKWEYITLGYFLKTINGKVIQEYKVISLNDTELVLKELGEEESIIGFKK